MAASTAVTLGSRARDHAHASDRRHHIVAKMNKAIDEVRAGEARRMKSDGHEPLLKHTRWCLLKRPENLTDNQRVKLTDLLRYNLLPVLGGIQHDYRAAA